MVINWDDVIIKKSYKVYFDTVTTEPVATLPSIKIGDQFVCDFDPSETVEIVVLGKDGEIVYEYEDYSVDYAANEAEFYERGFSRFSTSGWINVIYDADLKEVFFDDGVYVTEENAINASEQWDVASWTRLDTVYLDWGGLKCW